MANLLYLVAAVFISAVLCLVLWMRNRKPHSTEAAIDSFQRGLQALAPGKGPTGHVSQGPSEREKPPPG